MAIHRPGASCFMLQHSVGEKWGNYGKQYIVIRYYSESCWKVRAIMFVDSFAEANFGKWSGSQIEHAMEIWRAGFQSLKRPDKIENVNMKLGYDVHVMFGYIYI